MTEELRIVKKSFWNSIHAAGEIVEQHRVVAIPQGFFWPPRKIEWRIQSLSNSNQCIGNLYIFVSLFTGKKSQVLHIRVIVYTEFYLQLSLWFWDYHFASQLFITAIAFPSWKALTWIATAIIFEVSVTMFHMWYATIDHKIQIQVSCRMCGWIRHCLTVRVSDNYVHVVGQWSCIVENAASVWVAQFGAAAPRPRENVSGEGTVSCAQVPLQLSAVRLPRIVTATPHNYSFDARNRRLIDRGLQVFLCGNYKVQLIKNLRRLSIVSVVEIITPQFLTAAWIIRIFFLGEM